MFAWYTCWAPQYPLDLEMSQFDLCVRDFAAFLLPRRRRTLHWSYHLDSLSTIIIYKLPLQKSKLHQACLAAQRRIIGMFVDKTRSVQKTIAPFLFNLRPTIAPALTGSRALMKITREPRYGNVHRLHVTFDARKQQRAGIKSLNTTKK